MLLGNWLSDHVLRQHLAAWGWNLGAVNLGIYLGWAAVANPKLQSKTSPVFGVPLTDFEISNSVAIPYIITIISAPVWNYIAHVLGRKITGYLTALCYMIYSGLLLKTKSLQVLFVGRVIGGLAFVPVMFNGPMYVAEIAEAKNLRKLSSTYLISQNIGTLMIYTIGGYFSYSFINMVSTVFAVLFLFAIVIFPESPVFYLKKCRFKEAKLSLQYFRPKYNETYVDEELNRLKEALLLYERMRFAHLFSRHAWMATFITLYILLAVHFTGIDYIIMYTLNIFQQSKSLIDPHMCVIIGGVVYTLAPILCFPITKSLSRKTISILFYTFQSLALGALGWYYFYIDHNSIDNNSPMNYLPVVCMSFYLLSYSAGTGTMPFNLYGEIFSSEVHNTIVPFIYVWNALAMFLVTELVPTLLLHTIHLSGVFWGFSAGCVLIVIFTLVFIPETNDKPFLTDIDDLCENTIKK